MANIYLGLTESTAILLPRIRWTGGGSPSFPIDYSKQVDKATMLSGATRFNFKSQHPRRWSLSWEMLTVAEFADFVTLNGHNQELYFQNNWEDDIWRQVVIVNFTPDAVVKTGGCGPVYGDPFYGDPLYGISSRWNLDITLEEVR